jgi:hypothetical protein
MGHFSGAFVNYFEETSTSLIGGDANEAFFWTGFFRGEQNEFLAAMSSSYFGKRS